jgi:hypothetical protein
MRLLKGHDLVFRGQVEEDMTSDKGKLLYN